MQYLHNIYNIYTRRKNAGTRRRGSQCTTPAGEAGSCQYILASQCQPVLNVILQQGVTQQVVNIALSSS